MRSRLFNEVSQKHSVFVAAESSKTEGAGVEVTADVYFPSGNQTWQWKIHHLSMVFLLNPPISSGIYEPFVILGGFFFLGACGRQEPPLPSSLPVKLEICSGNGDWVAWCPFVES